MTAPVVTALRARGPARVAVELDGLPWRIVPLEAVYSARLSVGVHLDRVAARAVGRELRRHEARDVALRALRARDHTAASLRRRLVERGTRGSLAGETVEAAQRAGLVDDRRFAVERARLLASRGAGDLLVADDLERHGVPDDLAREAIGGLEPETARATAIVERRGRTHRTVRYVAARGFSEATIETLVAELNLEAVG